MGISDGGSVEGNRTIDGIGNSHDRQGVGAVDLRGLYGNNASFFNRGKASR